MTIHGGQHQRRDAQLGPSPGVDLGSVGQQQLDDVGVSSAGGQAERGVVRHIAMLLVGSARQQDLHHLVSSSTASQGQGSVLGPLRLSLDVSSMVDQNFHHLQLNIIESSVTIMANRESCFDHIKSTPTPCHHICILTLSCPAVAARMSGVNPFLSLCSMSAPRLRSRLTSSS